VLIEVSRQLVTDNWGINLDIMHYFKAISLLGPLLYGRSAARWSGFGNPADLDGYPEVFLDKPPVGCKLVASPCKAVLND